MIFALIQCLAFPPVTGPEYPNDIVPVRKAYRHNSLANLAKAVITLFIPAMVHVFCDHAVKVGKGILRLNERDARVMISP